METEDIKKETTETFNQVKNTIKNANLKNDTKEAKGFFISFFQNPLEEIKKATNSTFPISLIIYSIIFLTYLRT